MASHATSGSRSAGGAPLDGQAWWDEVEQWRAQHGDPFDLAEYNTPFAYACALKLCRSKGVPLPAGIENADTVNARMVDRAKPREVETAHGTGLTCEKGMEHDICKRDEVMQENSEGHDEARATQPVQADLSTLSLADEITAVPSRTKIASIAASASPHDAVAPPSPSSDVPLVDAQQPTNASGKRRRVFRNSPVGDDTGPVPAAEQPADDAQSDALYKWPPFSLANPSISMPGGLRVNVPLGRAGPIFGDLQHDDQIRRLKRLLQQNDLDGRFNSVLPKAADSDAVERLRRICAVFPVVVVDAADEPSLSFPPSTPLNHDIALGSKQLLRYYVYYLYAKAPDSETLRRLLRLAREPVWQNKAEAASLEVYWSEYLLKLEEKVGERRQLEVLRYVGWSDGFDHVEPGRAVYFRPSAHFSTPAATPKSLNALVLQLILDFNTEVEADGRSPIELSISFLATAETLPTDLSHTDVMLLEAVAATRFQTGVVSGGTNVSSAGGVSNRREMLQAARALPPEETLLALVHREPPGATSSSAVLVLAQHYGSFGTVAAAKARLEQDLAAGSASPEVAARLAREDSSAEADKRRRSILQPLFAAAPPPAPPVPAPPPPTQPAHTALCSSTALTNRSNASPRSSGKAPTWITPQGRHSTQSQSRREVDSVLRKFHPSLRQRLEAFRDEPFALALFDMIWSNTKRESGYSGILTPQTLTQGVEVELRSPSPRHPTRHRITVYACAGHDTALLSFWVSTASHPSRAIMKVEGDKIVVRSETSGRCIGIREKRGPSQPATPWKWTATHMLERVQRPSDVINKEAARRKRVLQRCLREAFARSAAAPRTAAKNGLESYAYSLRNSIDGDLKDKIEASDKETLDKAISETVSWLDASAEASKDEYEEKQKELEGVANPIMQKVYAAAGGAPGGMPTGGMPGGAAPGAGADEPSVEEID